MRKDGFWVMCLVCSTTNVVEKLEDGWKRRNNLLFIFLAPKTGLL